MLAALMTLPPLKNLFFKKDSCEQKTSPIVKPKDDNIPDFTIPEPILEKNNQPTMKQIYDTFDVIVQRHADVGHVRIKSDKSHLISVIFCTSHCFETHNLFDIHGTGRIDYNLHYVYKKTETPFVIRLFETDGGNFFQQVIHTDESVTFKVITRARAQEISIACESETTKNIWEEKSSFCRAVVAPGHYTTRFPESKACGSFECVDSFIIVDKERYDRIIETL